MGIDADPLLPFAISRGPFENEHSVSLANEDNIRPTRPFIRMEILATRDISLAFLLFYIAFASSVCLGLWGDSFQFSVFDMTPSSVHNNVYGGQTWTGFFSTSHRTLDIALSSKIQIFPNENESFTSPMVYRSEDLKFHLFVADDMCTFPYGTEASISCYDLIATTPVNVSFLCERSHDEWSCGSMGLASFDDIPPTGSYFAIQLVYKGFYAEAGDTKWIADPSIMITVAHRRDSYILFTMGVRTIIAAITFIFSGFYVYRYWTSPRDIYVSEHIWMSWLLGTLLVMNLYWCLEGLWGSVVVDSVVDVILVQTFKTTLFVYAWLVVDSIVRTQKILKNPSPGEMCSRTGLPCLGWRFYLPKLALTVPMVIGMCSQVLIPIYRIQVDCSLIKAKLDYYYFVSRIILFTSWMFWTILFVISLIRARQTLSRLPYLSTRFRQVSYRLILAVFPLLVIYTFFRSYVQYDLLKSTVNHSVDEGSVLSNLFTLELSGGTYGSFYGFDVWEIILESTIVLVFSMMFLPVTDEEAGHFIRDRSSKSGAMAKFSFRTAEILLDFAIRSYFPDFVDVCSGTINTPPSGKNCFDSTFKPTDISVEEYKFTPVGYIHNDDLDLHCRILRRDHVILIVFRGTASFRNFKTDMTFARKNIHSLMQNLTLSMGGGNHETGQEWEEEIGGLRSDGKVHSGFLEAYQALQVPLLRQIHALLLTDNPPISFFCTGHSLGAALSSLCSFDLRTRFNLQVHNYAFGCPRIGNPSFAISFDKVVKYSYRITFDRDLVTTLPRFIALYRHAGLEIVIDSCGNYLVGPTIVERMLKSRSSLKDHSRISYKRGIHSVASMFPRDTGFLSQFLCKYDPFFSSALYEAGN